MISRGQSSIQRAELKAIIMALQQFNQHINIVAGSHYVVYRIQNIEQDY